MDDGWRTGFDNGLPVFDAHGVKVTYYPVTQTFDFPDFITAEMLQDVAARGHEVGNHTRTHADLTTLDAQEAQTEVVGANDELAALGLSATTFAYPYGASNASVRAMVQDAGLAGARGTDDGYADKNSDRYNLPAWDIGNKSFAEIKDIIDGATAQKKWVILIVHKVDVEGDPESVSSATLEQVLDYVEAQGVETITNAEGLAKLSEIE
jgi:peptidoglycan/xylan/chitin deacetylase (PgdA/CDA1 family)